MIESERCILITLNEADYYDVKKLFMDKEVMRYLGGTADEDKFRTKFSGYLAESDSLYWVIRKKEANQFIGLVSLGLHHNGVNKEVSYMLLPIWWGYGYATEVLKEVINYAFKDLKLLDVIAETQIANKASRKLLEKVGMCLVHRLKRFSAEQGIYSIKNTFK